MKVYKYEFLIDDSNQHEWYNSKVTHVSHFLINSQENRESFMRLVGKHCEKFIGGLSTKYVGYKITEIEVLE